MNPTEPRGLADPREYEPAYKAAISQHFDITKLDFAAFGMQTEIPEHQAIPVADIAWPGICAIEVKTKPDLAGSGASGRLHWAIWHMFLLKIAGRITDFAIQVRAVSEPLDEHAMASYLFTRQMLAKYQKRYGFTILISEGPDDTCAIATSFMRECWQPKSPDMPSPLIPKSWLEWDFGVVVISAIRGWAVERATRLLSNRPFWGVMLDAHEMDVDAFCSAYGQLYGFGGKENKLLRELWKWFNSADTIHEVDVRPLFRMKTAAELVQLAEEVRNT